MAILIYKRLTDPIEAEFKMKHKVKKCNSFKTTTRGAKPYIICLQEQVCSKLEPSFSDPVLFFLIDIGCIVKGVVRLARLLLH